MKNNAIILLSFCFIIFFSCKKESSRVNDNNNNQYTKPLDSCFYIIWEENGIHKEIIDTMSWLNEYGQSTYFSSIGPRIECFKWVGLEYRREIVPIVFNLVGEPLHVNSGNDSITMNEILALENKRIVNNIRVNNKIIRIDFLAQVGFFPQSIYDTIYDYQTNYNVPSSFENYFKINKAKYISAFYVNNKNKKLLIIEGEFSRQILKSASILDTTTQYPTLIGVNYGEILNYKKGTFRIPLVVY